MRVSILLLVACTLSATAAVAQPNHDGHGMRPCCGQRVTNDGNICPATPTRTVTLTRTPTSTPTHTPTPTNTFTPTPPPPTATPTITATPTPTVTNTPTPGEDALFAQGCFAGNSTDSRDITVGFEPHYVLVQAQLNDSFAWQRTDDYVGDDACRIESNASTCGANRIQAFGATTFQVGTDAAVNATGTDYCWAAWGETGNQVKVGTYAGDDAAGDRAITGVGFQPDVVLLSERGALSLNGTWDRTSDMSANEHCVWNGCPGSCCQTATNLLHTLDADGFTVGIVMNNLLNTYYYLALKSGTGTVRMLHGSYNGSGAGDQAVDTACDADGIQAVFLLGNGSNAGVNYCSIWRPLSIDAAQGDFGFNPDTSGDGGNNIGGWLKDFSGDDFVAEDDGTNGSCNENPGAYRWFGYCGP